MKDNLDSFFSENNFDIQELTTGHLDRFERKLKIIGKKQKVSWKWMSVAASVVLMIGFWMGNNHQNNEKNDLAAISPEMKEVQNYFVNSIRYELKNIEKNRNLNTESIIEHALEEIEELEDSYQLFVKDLSKNGQEHRIINAMIQNYQQRLQILQNVLNQIEEQKTIKFIQNEVI